jgi:hypothetical protein
LVLFKLKIQRAIKFLPSVLDMTFSVSIIMMTMVTLMTMVLMFIRMNWVVVHRNLHDVWFDYDWIRSFDWNVNGEWHFRFFDHRNFDLLVDWIFLDVMVVNCVDSHWLVVMVISSYLVVGDDEKGHNSE